MPKKGRGKQGPVEPDPLDLPGDLQTALEVLYGHYAKTFEKWQEAGIQVPPCFIVVCNNTSASKLVYDYISGFDRKTEQGETPVPGRLELFRNTDEHGNPVPRPRTLLIDSEQLESDEALDDNFRKAAGPEIERFRREKIQREGQGNVGDLSDKQILREVMNTVGKRGQIGSSIRCVVSVSMLTEGWDANTVTHVLGVRAFGTQLLCEQVIGRALRRQSYDLNAENKFDVEYADVLGIPFNFNAKPAIPTIKPPRETILVQAMRPERDHLEIRFPRVSGYRVELPAEKLTARFNEESRLVLDPRLVGVTITHNSGIIGEGVDLNLDHTQDMRTSTVLFHLAKRLLYTKWRDSGDDPKSHLFNQLKRIAKQWLDEGYLECQGGTYPAQLLNRGIDDLACERISAGITRSLIGDCPVKAILDPYNPDGSTNHVRFTTSKTERWETRADRCHVNYAILDSGWEGEFCRVAESHPRVRAYVKNQNLGLEVLYRWLSENRRYLPDFILRVEDGHGEANLLNLIVEIKGYRGEDAKEKKSTMDTYWIPGVNNLGTHGRWAFAEFTEVYQLEPDLSEKIESEFNRMIDQTVGAGL
jgi:type III restriction enzyme